MKPFVFALLRIKFLIFLLLLCWASKTKLVAQDKSPISRQDIHLADPAILYFNGIYYLYGTVEGNTNEGFLVYTSTNLKSWEGPKGVNAGFALRKGDAYGERGFWAPQVFYHRQKFYMAYTANEQIAIATSNNPLGPFTQTEKIALTAPVKQIDPYVFIDDDGKIYLYHVRLSNGNRLFVAEMMDDFSAIKPETLRECMTASDPWENTVQASWPVAEGPSVLKHQGRYYFVYSANDFRNPSYAVGYAVSNSPLGPWQKFAGNPIISKNNVGQNGTGHGDFLKDKKGRLYYVLHTHNAPNKVGPRKTALIQVRLVPDKASGIDKLVINAKSFFYLQLKQN